MLLANAFAMENPNIRADAVEATEFPHLAQRHHVMGVPRTVVNGGHGIEGAMPERMFLEQVLAAANPEAS